MRKFQKIMSVMLTIVLLMCISGCGNGAENGNHLGASDSDVKQFAAFLTDDAYADAITQYNTKIAGNSKLELEAVKCIETYLSEIREYVLTGEYDKAEAQIKTNTVEKVYSSTDCKPLNYYELTDEIEIALASKVAYKSGISLFESENYADAIAEFAKVLPDDSDYKDAVEKQTEATDSYKKQIIKESDDCIANNDFAKAFEVLKKASDIVSDDTDLLAKLNTCEKNYIAKIVSESEAVFTDYTKYEDALKIIQSGLQNYPDDQTLVGKRDYYQSFAPVNLYDLDAVKGETATYENDKSTYKDEYSKCFWIGYGDWGIWSGETDITFDLKGTYNKFSATIYGRSTKTEADHYLVVIVGDGKKLYENTSIVDNERPFEISADITDISDLTIIMKHSENGGPVTEGIGITNMILQKTVK